MALYKCGGSGENLLCIEKEYDSMTTYGVDNTVMHGGELYICLEDGVTGEWDSSKWERTYLDALGELDGSSVPELLWTNPNPKAAFANQKIELDLSDYTGVIIEYLLDDSNSIISNRLYVKKTDTFASVDGRNFFGAGYEGSSIMIRALQTVDDGGVYFRNSYLGTGTQTFNNTNIPYRIYGVKNNKLNSNLGELVLESTSYSFNTSVVEFDFNVDKHNTISYHLNGTTYGNYSITGYKKDGSSEVIYKSAQDVNVTGDYEYDVTLYTKVKINTTGKVNISNVLIK